MQIKNKMYISFNIINKCKIFLLTGDLSIACLLSRPPSSINQNNYCTSILKSEIKFSSFRIFLFQCAPFLFPANKYFIEIKRKSEILIRRNRQFFGQSPEARKRVGELARKFPEARTTVGHFLQKLPEARTNFGRFSQKVPEACSFFGQLSSQNRTFSYQNSQLNSLITIKYN